MTRDQMVSIYVSEQTKTELQQRADAADKTLSTYAANLLHRELQREAENEIESEVRASERIRELTQIAADEITQATEEIRDMNAKAGTYAAANFELLKTQHKDAVRRDSLATGSRRMRKDLDTVIDEIGDDAAQNRTDTDSGSSSDPFAHRK